MNVSVGSSVKKNSAIESADEVQSHNRGGFPMRSTSLLLLIFCLLLLIFCCSPIVGMTQSQRATAAEKARRLETFKRFVLAPVQNPKQRADFTFWELRRGFLWG